MISYRSLCAVPYFLLLLAAISFGASTANGKDAFLASQDSALSPPVESGSWLNSFWSNFGTKIQEGWNQFANGTSHTYQKAVSGIKETWDRVANQTSPTFSQVSTKLQDGWGGFANETVNTFSKVSTKFQDGWEAVANGTVSTYHTATSRLCFVFANLFCPSNKTENVTTITVPQETVEVKTLDSSPQYDDAEAIQTFSCTALKYLTVLGISLAGGLAVTLVLPVIFYLVLFALGFTGYGKFHFRHPI